METKQAVLPLSAPVRTSILLCFGNRHNHITVFDETVFVSSMTLYLQAGRAGTNSRFLNRIFQIQIQNACWAVPNPPSFCIVRCRLRVCSKHFYNKKRQPRTLPQRKNPRLSAFIGNVFLEWSSFLRQRTILHFSAHEEVPASRLSLCGSPGRMLSFPSAAWNIPHPVLSPWGAFLG